MRAHPPFVWNGRWGDGWGDHLNTLNGGKGLAFVEARPHLPACWVRVQRRRGRPALAGSERGCAGAHLGQVDEDDIPQLLLGEVRDADRALVLQQPVEEVSVKSKKEKGPGLLSTYVDPLVGYRETGAKEGARGHGVGGGDAKKGLATKGGGGNADEHHTHTR